MEPNVFLDELECESEKSLKQESDLWVQLYERCFDMIQENLHYILQFKLDHFLELRHFEDPTVAIQKEKDELRNKIVGKGSSKEPELDDNIKYCLKRCDNICEKLIYKAIYSNWLNQ